jgi:membrane-bound ClpP family serine protease
MELMEASYLAVGLALIVGGFLLMLAELFLPHGGALAIVSVGCISVGIAFAFFYDAVAGVLTLLGVIAALPLLMGAMAQYWPHTAMGRRFLLPGTAPDDTVASQPHLQDLERLKGRFGKTLSALRPAGVVDFDGRRVDTITEGMMVEPGQWVRCIDVRAGRVLVRPSEQPNLQGLEDAFFG